MMLKTAFGCCSLRTGSIILGVLWTLADLIQIIGYSADLAGDTTPGQTDYKVICAIGLFISLLHLLGDILLLLGADKGKAQWVNYAVINHFISFVLAVASLIAITFLFFFPALLLVDLIVCLTVGYCWLVVYSFYWQLVEVAMTETQAQLETSALTQSASLPEEEKRLAY